MLFSLLYKNSANQQINVYLSGSSMSAAILYCDTNNFTPLQITKINSNVLVNNPSFSKAYLVALKDITIENTSSTIIYDTFANVNSWIESQVNKSVVVISVQDRAFIQA